eukprot:1000043_1
MDQCHLMVYSDHGSKEIVFKNSNDLILAAQEQSKQGDEVLFEEKSTSIAATICEKMYARAVQLFVVYWCTSTSSMMKWMSPIFVLFRFVSFFCFLVLLYVNAVFCSSGFKNL